jgi:predicted nucleotidyltransferase
MIQSPGVNLKDKKSASLELPLSPGCIVSLLYHDIFDYPLTASELNKWKAGRISEGVREAVKKVKVEEKDGLYFLKGKEKSITKRESHEKASIKKLKIARDSSEVLSRIPTIKLVAVTGALAMNNVDKEEDVDLLIIVKKGTLWTTRLFVLLLLDVLRIPRRRYGDKDQKDKLCLNIWLDEGDLVWRAKNLFTAHEIAQVKPLINKKQTYEKFVYKNRWIKNYWPKAVRIKYQVAGSKEHGEKRKEHPLHTTFYFLLATIFEPLARELQYLYMKPKMTREVVTPTRALFHPVDWSKTVQSRLQNVLIPR